MLAELDQFEQLLVNEPVLPLPNFNKHSMLSNIASNIGTGTILTQQFEDGLHPLANASHKCYCTEKTSTEYNPGSAYKTAGHSQVSPPT